MTETVYIYTSDKYGDADLNPYLTTFEALQIRFSYKDVELTEREWASGQPRVVADQDNDILAGEATLERLVLHKMKPSGELFWRVVTLELAHVLFGLLDKRVSYKQAREAMRMYRILVGEYIE